jgi:hypothetical protein
MRTVLVGAVYQHRPGTTATEYDDHLFCLLTMYHNPSLQPGRHGRVFASRSTAVIGRVP